MTEGMPRPELLRRALDWIVAEQAENPGKNPHALVDEAGMRFNLSPADSSKLLNLLKPTINPK